MQASQNNLTQLNIKSVYNTIQNFLLYKGENEKTKAAYAKDIEDFFQITRNKQINQLTVQDLNYEFEDVIQYRITLQRMKKRNGERNYKNKSINRKISVVRNLFDFFKINSYNVNPYAFKLDDLNEKDSDEIDSLTWDEVKQMIEYAKTKAQGEQKAIFIEVAATTSIRLNALSNMKWKDIKLIDGVRVIKIYDKGDKLDEKAIQNELYEKLLTLKGDKKKDDNVFSLSYRTFQDMIPLFAKELGFSNEERKITAHSLKKSGATIVYELTGGDVKLTQEQANHADPSLTLRTYVKQKKDFTKMGSYLIGQELDMSKLDEIDDVEVLKDIIKSCSMRVQSEIINKLNG